MTTNIRVVTPPSAEPMTLSEAREHLNLGDDETQFDAWIQRKITEAREQCEQYLERSLTDAEYEYRVDSFGCEIALPLGDIGAVSEISYVDEDGATQTLSTSDYVFDDNHRAPVVRRAYGVSWPATRCQANAITLTFQGRYNEVNSPAVSPPESIKGAMGMLIAHWHENREAVTVGVSGVELPMGVQYKLQPYRLSMGV